MRRIVSRVVKVRGVTVSLLSSPLRKVWAKAAKHNPESLIYFDIVEDGTASRVMLGDDAKTVSEILGLALEEKDGIPIVRIPAKRGAAALRKLKREGHEAKELEESIINPSIEIK